MSLKTERDWRPKLVALDIDGTTVDQTSVVPPSLAEKLREIDARGVPVVFVTGRAWCSTKMIVDQVDLDHGYYICNNGATIVSYPPARVVRTITFDISPITKVLKDYPSMVIAVEDFGRGYLISRTLPDSMTYELHGHHRHVPLEEMARLPAARIIVYDPEASSEDFFSRCSKLNLSAYSHFFSDNNWLDIASKQATKSSGLACVAQMLGVAQADVLAIGDSDNDMDMLAWAGRGVAMGDASYFVKACADHVTATLADNGVVMELVRWFPDDEG